MTTWKYILLGLPLLACGCAHGFHRVAVQERLSDGPAEITDSAVAEVRGLKPQLRLPCRIAVYLKPPAGGDWRWTPEDKAVLDYCAGVLKKERIAADVFPLPEIITGKGEMKELRLAAARCGADALLVVHGSAQTESYSNAAAVLNITVVGGYVVPSTHVDSLFVMEGVLVDVDNGYVYAAVQAEGGGKLLRPTFVAEDKDAVAVAKAKAVTVFGEEVVKRMRGVAARDSGRVVIEGTEAKATRHWSKPAAYSPAPKPVAKAPAAAPVVVAKPPVVKLPPSVVNAGESRPAPVEKPVVEKPAVEKPVADKQPVAEKPVAVEKPAVEKPGGVTRGLVPPGLIDPPPAVPVIPSIPVPSVPVPSLGTPPAPGGLTSGISSFAPDSK